MAIQELVLGPTNARGNTLMPLKNDRKGTWRYRIGDYRLIYSVEFTEKVVRLMAFKARSGTYQ